ncbi:hypothetical protein [Pseudonocardia sp. HH130629-09]|uniref:hypothetical protein n=1 Tax=Pseudonocardia sp. HH130629-09 TaxID=1641402 RepID=UPI0011AE583C|nr:hypothetical protein [Pseudonocardia sp. HH130629-09]
MVRRALDVVVYADVSVPYLDADVRCAVSDLLGDVWDPAAFRSGSTLATASVRGEVVGCALTRHSPAERPVRASPGLRALGPDRYQEWLAGCPELAGVAVSVGHRSSGVGSVVVDAVLTPARPRGGWTDLCGRDLAGAGPWLRRRGWVVAAADRDGAGAVLLAPRHPAATVADRRGASRGPLTEPGRGRPHRT